MAKRQVEDVEVTADRIVAGLVDRLIQAEKRCDHLQEQINEQYDLIVELQPFLTDEGRVRLRALRCEDATEFGIELQPASVKPWSDEDA